MIKTYLFRINDSNESFSDEDYTLFWEAVVESKIDIVESYIKRGINVNKPMNTGINASVLQRASMNGNSEMVSMLLKAGANVNVTNSSGVTSLISAASYNKPKVIEILLDHGADINHIDFSGDTALLIAAENGNYVSVKVLLDHEADTDIKNNRNRDVLEVARTDAIRDLIKKYIHQQKMKDIENTYEV